VVGIIFSTEKHLPTNQPIGGQYVYTVLYQCSRPLRHDLAWPASRRVFPDYTGVYAPSGEAHEWPAMATDRHCRRRALAQGATMTARQLPVFLLVIAMLLSEITVAVLAVFYA
jgi:hypothetical protein